MAFWGVEVKPGKPFKHLPNGGKGRLHVSQATLGIGSASNKSIVQCNVGNKTPVFLCSLFPEKSESSQLNLEFDEADEVVFSVIGPRSVHITGFYMGNSRNSRIDDESESYGEDIRDSITDKSEDNDEYDDSFINDDDPGVLPPSPCSTDEEEKPTSKPRKSRSLRKKYQVSESDSQSGDSPQLQNAVNGNGEVEEEEEEASDSEEVVGSFFKSLDKNNQTTTSKDSKERVDVPLAATDKHQRVAANTKNKKKRKTREGENTKNSVQCPDEENEQDQNQTSTKTVSNEAEVDTIAVESNTKKKKNKKNKKRKTEIMENDMDMDTGIDKKIASEENGDGESTQARTLPNGLIIEEIELGNPDGKVAAPGKKVSVHFTGKIKESGKVVDSNVGEEPLKFRLGSGEEVVGGFEDGVEGMRVGGKRRVTIPPALRKGNIRLKGKKIGSKASLVYEIEVVRIR